MAQKLNHTISYREGGSGPVKEQLVVAESRTMAVDQLLAAIPTARIEKVLTEVPSSQS
jgi:hypothetical protein